MGRASFDTQNSNNNLQPRKKENPLSSQTPHIFPSTFHPQEIMATLHFTSSPSFPLSKQPHLQKLPTFQIRARPRHGSSRQLSLRVQAYKVVIDHEGKTTELEVEEDESILAKALDTGLSVPHDCKLGVCMTCPARLVSGTIDQSEGMLSHDVVERGYALLCVAYPRSDCHIKTIPEEELLSLQLATAND